MTSENAYRVFLIVLAIVQSLISLRYLWRTKAYATVFQHRDEGMPLTCGIAVFYSAHAAAVFAYCINPAWMSWSAVEVPGWARWLGAIPLLTGAACMIWALAHLGANLTISISTKCGHRLIRSGPYRCVRHPIYAAGMLESLGVCLLMANWFAALSAGLFWILIAYRTPLEEEKLIALFGDDYRLYMRRVSRFVPAFRRS